MIIDDPKLSFATDLILALRIDAAVETNAQRPPPQLGKEDMLRDVHALVGERKPQSVGSDNRFLMDLSSASLMPSEAVEIVACPWRRAPEKTSWSESSLD